MIGPGRPLFVLFGSSIVQFSYSNEGWGAILAHAYARKPFVGGPLYLLERQGKTTGWSFYFHCLLLSILLITLFLLEKERADIILRGYAGWNSRRALEVLDKVFPKDAAVQPSLVIVYFGGNDSTEPHPSGLGPHVPLPEYVENMKKIAMHLKGLSENTHVMFLSTPPMNEGQILESFGKCGRTNEGCRIYSEACLKLCQEVDIKCIDLWTAIQQRDDWKTVCFTDGVHLSSEGSKLVGEEILKALAEEPSLCWRSLPTEFDEDSVSDPVDEEGKNINISNL